MQQVAVCYVTDRDFLFASIASAISVRSFVPAASADCIIFAVTDDEPQLKELERLLGRYALTFVAIKPRWLGNYDESKFRKFHVPPAALGRLLINELLPRSCRVFLYLDGDTLVCGPLTPLLNQTLKPGEIAAAEDMMSFCRDEDSEFGAALREYLPALGVPERGRYFNSGVILSTTETWQRLGPEAYGFFCANTEKCRHHDQSALNIVGGSNRVAISLAWNFQKLFRQWSLGPLGARARLNHFAGFPKPWMGYFPPLTGFHAVYAAHAASPWARDLHRKTLPSAAIRKVWAEHFAKAAFLQTVGRQKLQARRRQIFAYEAACAV